MKSPDRASVTVCTKVRVVVPGGKQRVDSVRQGVRWTSFEVDVIAIHDAARPLIESECIDRSIEVAADLGAAVVALPVTDTIKPRTYLLVRNTAICLLREKQTLQSS